MHTFIVEPSTRDSKMTFGRPPAPVPMSGDPSSRCLPSEVVTGIPMVPVSSVDSTIINTDPKPMSSLLERPDEENPSSGWASLAS